MTARLITVRRGTYADSLQLMSATSSMLDHEGVAWAAAVMGTPGNVADLAAEGFEDPQLAAAEANDLVIAVRAESGELARKAVTAAEEALASLAPGKESPGTGQGQTAGPAEPRSLEEAAAALPGANVALISVPGPYAAIEAHKALSAGLHTLLFSDNVSVADEVALKRRAAGLGLLLMGPGAGTSFLGGTGLGFANVVRPGPVGVIAAAGTGAQEIMTLVHRWGSGISSVIGIGGRDLHDDVGGLMGDLALSALAADQNTQVLVLVSKPPSPQVAARFLAHLGAKPAVAALIGLGEVPAVAGSVRLAGSLEDAAAAAVSRLGLTPPDVGRGLAEAAAKAAARLEPTRVAVRGLFSGGTLCSEAMLLISKRLGPVYSNVPLHPGWARPVPAAAHACLDLGEEEYTRGHPHPMIDARARVAHIAREAADPATAVILLDVVLGHGSHPDPAAALAPACEHALRNGRGPAVVAYVLGTGEDPQDRDRQERTLAGAGCIIAPTGARAALLAAAIAARRPKIAGEAP